MSKEAKAQEAQIKEGQIKEGQIVDLQKRVEVTATAQHPCGEAGAKLLVSPLVVSKLKQKGFID